MKWVRTIIVINEGDVISSDDWRTLHDSYTRAIQSIVHPAGATSLTIRRRRKKATTRGGFERNGVVPLKQQFLRAMTANEGWASEGNLRKMRNQIPPQLIEYPSIKPYSEPISSRFGNFDFITKTSGGLSAAIEWETGNISSSHRSVNKLVAALTVGAIAVGVLIVPSRDLYKHLTDRIGNISELSGYLGFWHAAGKGIEQGLLAITVVEHDALTDNEDIKYLPRGTDGRAEK